MFGKKFLIYVMGCLFCAQSAMAVPKLRETAADFNSAIVTIYPDSVNPNLFYFMTNTGALAKDASGYPLVSLTYTTGQDAKAFFTGVFEAGMTPAVKEELQAFQKKHPGARLTVVPFGRSFLTFGVPIALNPPSSAAVQAMVPDPAPPGQDMAAAVAAQKPPTTGWPEFRPGAGSAPSQLFENLYLPPYAGVAETQVGFNAILSKWGTRIMVNSIKGLTPMNLNLCYQVFGALPTMQATITINYQRVYSYIQASVQGGWLFWGWSLAAVVEKLREHGDITITMTGADQKMEDYVLKIAENLAARWLTPTLSASPGPTPGNAGFAFTQYGLSSTYKEENKDVTYNLAEQVFTSDDRCVSLPLSNLTPYADKILINADGGI